MYNLRLSTPADETAILALALDFTEAAFPRSRVDVMKVVNLVNSYVAAPSPTKVCLVLDHAEKGVVGVLAGQVIESVLTKGTTAFEQMWWVSPEHRNKRIVLSMIPLFEEWAKKVGAGEVILAGLASSTNVNNLYSRLGYVPSEYAYSKLIKEV